MVDCNVLIVTVEAFELFVMVLQNVMIVEKTLFIGNNI